MKEEGKDDFIEGSFIFKAYETNRLRNQDDPLRIEEVYSNPILVDGVIYRLEFLPNGYKKYKGE